MAEFKDREHYIPLRPNELIDLLCSETDSVCGQPLDHTEQDAFRRLCGRLSGYYHIAYYPHFQRLKDAYAPFDPDADTKALSTPAPDERQTRLDHLFAEFSWLLERANYRRLSHEEILAATAEVSHWGLNMSVDFDVFERLEVYYRGDTFGQRTLRRMRNWYRLETVPVPIFQRLALILKQRPHKRLGPNADTRNVYIKLFKDIPKMDVEMLLPGAETRMPTMQRGKLGVSMASTAGIVVWKIAQAINGILNNPWSFYGPLGIVLGYGYRQWAGFQSVRKSYSLLLTQSLYYQNLDNNAGVFHRLLDAAEEQECREAVMAYFFLWRCAGADGWTPTTLDDFVERYLELRANLHVDFEIGETALDKLVTLHFVERTGDAYRAVPIQHAVRLLGAADTQLFNDSHPATSVAGVHS